MSADRDGRRACGSSTRAGGRRGSPTAPTRSTRSRSCRWPPSGWPGADGVLDVGCGEGQVARLAAARPASRPRVVGVDPTWGQIAVAARAGGGPAYACSGAGALPVRRRRRSTPSWPAWCSSTSATSTTPSPRWPGCCGPGGRFVFFLNHPLLQTPNSGWIDDQILDPPEQYWRIGPYLVEDETIEEVEKGVFIPFIHRPLSPVRERHGRQRPAGRAHGGAGAAARLPGPGRGVRRRRPPSRAALSAYLRRPSRPERDVDRRSHGSVAGDGAASWRPRR